MPNARKTTPEKPETVPPAGPHVEIIYDLDESLEVVRRHFSLSDFQDELLSHPSAIPSFFRQSRRFD